MIRKYTESDIDELLEVWFASSSLAHPFLDSAFMEQERKNIREIYMPNTETWVFMEGGILLGFIAMMGNEVGALFVRPDRHGGGIGRALMDFVMQFHAVVEVEVFKKNSIGRAFYDRYGFETMKESVHEASQEGLLRMKFEK